MKKRNWLVGLAAIAVALMAATAQALPVVYTISTGGLDDGGGCTTNAQCISDTGTSFTYAPPGSGFDPASGTITLDQGAGTIAINFSIASATFLDTAGAVNGVDEVEFTSVSYVGTLTYTNTGGLLNVDSGQTVAVNGTAEQLLAGGNVVGPAGFARTANVTAGQCTLVGNFLTCGFDIGPGGTPGFNLGIGSSSPVNRKFLHTFNVVAVPEPGTVALLGLGLLGIAAVRRRA